MLDNIVLKPIQGKIASFSPQNTKETTSFHVMQPFAKLRFKPDRRNIFVGGRDVVGLGNNCVGTLLDFESCSKCSSPK